MADQDPQTGGSWLRDEETGALNPNPSGDAPVAADPDQAPDQE